MKIGKEFLNDKKGKEKEWLIANGLGGYASSTIINLNTRKYHGLLIAALRKKFLVLSKLEEEITIGSKVYELSNNKYPGDVIQARGFEFLENFNLTYFPKFIYNVDGVYLFSWDDVPGNDSEQLLKHLVDNLKIDWVKNAEIKKSDDGKTITITMGENSLIFKLNEEENIVNLKIDGEKTHEYISKKENDKLNIYDGVIIKKTIFMVHGHNAVISSYEVENQKNPEQEIILKVRPLINSRGFHDNLNSEFSGLYFQEKPDKKSTEIRANYEYLFSWDDFPGNDSERVLKFLKDNLGLKWVENAEIKKSDDGEVITITNGENSLTFNLKKEENKVTLEISGLGTHEYILKEENGKLNIYNYENAPTLIIGSDIMDYSKNGIWIKNIIYEKETERGEGDRDDHYCPGEFLLNIKKGIKKFNILAVAGIDDDDVKKIFKKFYLENPEFYEELLNNEKTRIEKVVENTYKNCKIKEKDKVIDLLSSAADSFIIQKKDGKSIIAGYHWFSDWGRDTMISITGLCLVTGRFEDAGEILKTYTRYCKKGILPNRFDDYGEEPAYNTSDASLWFFYAVYKFLEYSDDYEFVKNNLWETLKDIISYYAKGTYTVRMDSDGLIISEAQTTWMDAKIGNFVVTPRVGKCVEINALWYNALKIMESLSEKFGEDSSEYKKLSKKANESFNKLFWNDGKKCLYDLISENNDDSIRPNQIFAVSLPFSILDREKEEKIVERVFEELYTPFGLRSLSQKDEKYIGVYKGDRYHRDTAYHQGTVWAWLLGHFITAYVKVNSESEESKKQAKEFLSKIFEHLNDTGLGSISEIFDGDFPHNPRGCISQAWSVAEILRCYGEDVLK
ncbi:MAG: hypothetical protein A7315_07905 [Candidatus Altiarchaeales archaeon WOR_SM1_79]|nr:MAG: hypothetical protein A7315_07905 [Candidatus Altiarchaeales archaeon WOR_SM1_79]